MWFRVLIGALGVGAAALVLVPSRLVPRAAPLGAAIAVMLGGMGTHVVRDGGRHVTSEVVPIVLASRVLWARRAEWRSARPLSRPRAAMSART